MAEVLSMQLIAFDEFAGEQLVGSVKNVQICANYCNVPAVSAASMITETQTVGVE